MRIVKEQLTNIEQKIVSEFSKIADTALIRIVYDDKQVHVFVVSAPALLGFFQAQFIRDVVEKTQEFNLTAQQQIWISALPRDWVCLEGKIIFDRREALVPDGRLNFAL